ncbi:MAG TPA: FAD-binding oxidoreductase [Candidatus Binatia bacterium]|nr:FAD-binding oxidoreductase [Candidatus Binatia bacterium]
MAGTSGLDALLAKLRATVGAAHVLTGADRSPFVIEGRTPDAVVFPGSADEVGAVVRQAAAAGIPVLPWGGGTAAAVGPPPARGGLVLALKRLDRLVEHEPGDLTVTVEAGLTLDALQSALRARGQWLSLDPPDAARATVGGLIAANASGPRRHLYGTVRDLLIGVSVVTADGTVVRGGGKVVKNVAGYDVPKLFVGSYGTLGIVVSATFKLRPVPEDERLVAVTFDRLKDCGAAARAVLAGDLIPSALEILDAAAGAPLGLGGVTLVVGFDGLREQVEAQASALAAMAGSLGGRPATTLPASAWARLAAPARDAFGSPAAVMSLSVLPTTVSDMMEQGMEAARRRGLASAWAAHAGVGAVTGALAAEREATTVGAVLAEWRALARAAGGHATLLWAPLAVKSDVPVWDDAGPAGRIMQKIKAQLDPNNVLNPGRFVAGI